MIMLLPNIETTDDSLSRCQLDYTDRPMDEDDDDDTEDTTDDCFMVGIPCNYTQSFLSAWPIIGPWDSKSHLYVAWHLNPWPIEKKS